MKLWMGKLNSGYHSCQRLPGTQTYIWRLPRKPNLCPNSFNILHAQPVHLILYFWASPITLTRSMISPADPIRPTFCFGSKSHYTLLLQYYILLRCLVMLRVRKEEKFWSISSKGEERLRGKEMLIWFMKPTYIFLYN